MNYVLILIQIWTTLLTLMSKPPPVLTLRSRPSVVLERRIFFKDLDLRSRSYPHYQRSRPRLTSLKYNLRNLIRLATLRVCSTMFFRCIFGGEWPDFTRLILMGGTWSDFEAGVTVPSPWHYVIPSAEVEDILHTFLGGDTQMVAITETFRGGLLRNRAGESFFIGSTILRPLLDQIPEEDRETVDGDFDVDFAQVPAGVEVANLAWPPLPWTAYKAEE